MTTSYLNIFTLLVIVFANKGSSSNFGDEESRAISRNWKSKPEDFILDEHHDCSRDSSGWLCLEECRYAQAERTGKCKRPAPSTTCFGMPINYTYVKAPNPLDIRLFSLSMWPKCWSSVAPLICMYHFRPCSIRITMRKEETGLVEEEIEFWMLLRKSLCRKAAKACDGLERFLPDYLECSAYNYTVAVAESPENTTASPSENEHSFWSEKCLLHQAYYPVDWTQSPICPSPLVYREYVDVAVTPVLDSCYIPCRKASALRYRTNQKLPLRILCLLFFLLFLLPAVYLRFFSFYHPKNAILLCIEKSLLSAAFYYFFWMLGSFDAFANMAECLGSDLYVSPELQHRFSWCRIQSFCLQFNLIGAHGWMLAHFFCSMLKPDWVEKRKTANSRFHIRSTLLATVYGVDLVICCLSSALDLTESDNVSGVCFIGLQSTLKLLILTLPLLLMSVLLLVAWTYRYPKTYKKTISVATKAARQAFEQEEDYGRLRRYRVLYARGNHEPTVQELLELSEIDVTAAEEANGLALPERKVKEINAAINERDLKPKGFIERAAKSFENQARKWVNNEQVSSPKDDLVDCATKEFGTTLSHEFSSRRQNWMTSLWPRWTYCSMICAGASLVMMIVCHFALVHKGYSTDENMRSLRCSVEKAFGNESLDWYPGHGKFTPLAPSDFGCNGHEAEEHNAGTIIVFIILPSLPFLVVVFAFFAGCSDCGGMSKVKKLRPCIVSKCPKTEYKTLDDSADIEDPVKHSTSEPENAAAESKLAPSVSSDHSGLHNPTSSGTMAQHSALPQPSSEVPANSVSTSVPNPDLTKMMAALKALSSREGTWKEKERTLIRYVRDISSFLTFMESMLTRDTATWNQTQEVLLRLQRGFNTLFPENRVVETPVPQVNEFLRDMHSVHELLNSTISTLSDHTQGFPTWNMTVQDALMIIRHAAACLAGVERTTSAGQRESKPAPSTSQNAARTSNSQPAAVPSTSRNSAPVQVSQVRPRASAATGRNPPEAAVPRASRSVPNQVQNAVSPPVVEPAEAGPSGSNASASAVSAYIAAYNVVPRGFVTRLSDMELQLRASRMRELVNDSLFPQDIITTLILTGDIRPGSSSILREEERHVPVNRLRSIFGQAPTIDVRLEPSVFFVAIQRRAALFVSSIGYHYLHAGQPRENYVPPRVPALGMEQWETELHYGRILGAESLLPIRESSRAIIASPNRARPELPLVAAFTAYMDMFCSERGFPVQKDEFVPDPEPRQDLLRPDDFNSSDEEERLREEREVAWAEGQNDSDQEENEEAH